MQPAWIIIFAPFIPFPLLPHQTPLIGIDLAYVMPVLSYTQKLQEFPYLISIFTESRQALKYRGGSPYCGCMFVFSFLKVMSTGFW